MNLPTWAMQGVYTYVHVEDCIDYTITCNLIRYDVIVHVRVCTLIRTVTCAPVIYIDC